jgi:peptidoglycan/xylan/chitin deacetylase (PgdA/CDA1 family)
MKSVTKMRSPALIRPRICVRRLQSAQARCCSLRKKELLARLAYHSGAAHIANYFSRSVDTLLILAYHRILPPSDAFRFDKELISAYPKEFSWQMQHIRKNYNPINFQTLKEIVRRNECLPPRAVIVTFDDGYDDNFKYALPILRENNMPATFFICPDYIGTDRVFWFDWAAYLCGGLSHDVTLSAALSEKTITLSAVEGVDTRCHHFLSFLKRSPDVDRRSLVAQLEDIVKPIQKTFTDSRPMSWQQVKEAQRSGIAEFASHTLSHPVLSQVDEPALTRELYESKQIIEAQLQVPCTALAYPVGGVDDINADVLAAVARCGYDYACIYRSGANKLPLLRPFELHRLHIERYTTRAWFASMLAYSLSTGR